MVARRNKRFVISISSLSVAHVFKIPLGFPPILAGKSIHKGDEGGVVSTGGLCCPLPLFRWLPISLSNPIVFMAVCMSYDNLADGFRGHRSDQDFCSLLAGSRASRLWGVKGLDVICMGLRCVYL